MAIGSQKPSPGTLNNAMSVVLKQGLDREYKKIFDKKESLVTDAQMGKILGFLGLDIEKTETGEISRILEGLGTNNEHLGLKVNRM